MKYIFHIYFYFLISDALLAVRPLPELPSMLMSQGGPGPPSSLSQHLDSMSGVAGSSFTPTSGGLVHGLPPHSLQHSQQQQPITHTSAHAAPLTPGSSVVTTPGRDVNADCSTIRLCV